MAFSPHFCRPWLWAVLLGRVRYYIRSQSDSTMVDRINNFISGIASPRSSPGSVYIRCYMSMISSVYIHQTSLAYVLLGTIMLRTIITCLWRSVRRPNPSFFVLYFAWDRCLWWGVFSNILRVFHRSLGTEVSHIKTSVLSGPHHLFCTYVCNYLTLPK